MAMPQCCYLAKGAKRPSHKTNTIKFDRIPFDPCSSIKRFDLCPFDQKNSTYLQPPKTDNGLISRIDDIRSNVFNAHQGKFGSQWLNVVPCKNLGPKHADQLLRISFGFTTVLRIRATVLKVERDGLHGLYWNSG